MNSVKPDISPEAVDNLLKKILKIDYENLVEINNGQISRNYSLTINNKSYMLQFNQLNMNQGCFNEKFFRGRFKYLGIPVRKVIYKGDYQNLYYTIAEKIPGVGLDKLSSESFTDILPSVMDILLKIAEVDTSDSTGFGWLDREGNGMFFSWREHLCQVKDEEPGMFYGRWHELFDTTFLDREVFDHYYSRMEDLIDKLPVRRELVHGGFGYGNVLADKNKITAVLDWQDSRYGDHLFDLAYITLWMDEVTRKECFRVYKEKLDELGRSEENLSDRIKCYSYYIGIDGFRFAAKTGNEKLYRDILGRLTNFSNLI